MRFYRSGTDIQRSADLLFDSPAANMVKISRWRALNDLDL